MKAFDSEIKLPIKRTIKLQHQFNHNYKNLARDFFRNLDEDIQSQLLNMEFQLDKDFLFILKSHDSEEDFFTKHISYFYTPSFERIPLEDGARVHIRHNLYRTIAAMLLTDCTFEEKVYILNKSNKHFNITSPKFFDIASQRLTNLEKHTNVHSL